MIKLIALITMLIDHIGVVFYPTSFGFRAIGRLSMPLFAYCVARGFYYSKQHGTLKKYLLRMLIFSIVSQVPYHFIVKDGLNIGFTWLISLLLLRICTVKHTSESSYVIFRITICGIICFLLYFGFLPVDYGLYGVITPLLFYMLIFTGKENVSTYTLVLACGWTFYVLAEHGPILQILSIFSAFILTVSIKFDKKIKLPKIVYYAFYPMHLLILLAIKHLIR